MGMPMRSVPRWSLWFSFAAAFCLVPFLVLPNSHTQENKEDPQVRLLPAPRQSGALSLEECLALRRSRRLYAQGSLTMEQIGQIFWAAQGVTDPERGLRTAPSAGALYPLEVYLVAGEGGIEGLEAGLFHYLPARHAIEKVRSGDLRQPLAAACLGQSWMARAPVLVVLTAEYERAERKYGARGQRYALMEAGHACQNLLLEVEALGLAAAVVGAFHDRNLSNALQLPEGREPLAVIPIGQRR